MLQSAAEYGLDLSFYSEKYAQRFQFHTEPCGDMLKVIFDDRRCFCPAIMWSLIAKESIKVFDSVEKLINYLVDTSNPE